MIMTKILFKLNDQQCPHDVMANVLDCDIVIREFELQTRHYVHLRTNTLGKGMSSPTMDPIVSLLFFDKDGFGIK